MSIHNKKSSFFAYFLRTLNSGVLERNSILQAGVCASQARRTLSMLDC